MKREIVHEKAENTEQVTQRSTCQILYPSHSVLNSRLPWMIIFLFLPHLFLASICIFRISTWYVIQIGCTFTFKSINCRLAHFNQYSYYSHFEIILWWLFRSLNKMLAKLPVEIILLICEYPESKELKQLARTSNRMMRIIKKYLPKALEREILFYRRKIFCCMSEN